VVPDVGFLDALASQCLTKLPGFTAEQLATSLWAMATLGYVPGTPLLEAAAGALGRNLSLFTPRYASASCEVAGSAVVVLRVCELCGRIRVLFEQWQVLGNVMS
jgi:hypothetical protein